MSKIIFIYDEKYPIKLLKSINDITPLKFNDPNLSAIEVLMNKISECEDADGFIIPCSLGSIHTKYYGIQLGLHIRLTKELKKKRFLPIIFLSYDKYEEICKFDEQNIAKLLLLKGCYFTEFNTIENMCKIFGEFSSFDLKKEESELQEDLNNSVLSKLILPMPYNKDRHSIANEWGVKRLAYLSCQNVPKHEPYCLYIKHQIATAKRNTGIKKEKEKEKEKKKNNKNFKNFIARFIAENKKLNILFIDNEAEKGWSELLQKLFIPDLKEKQKIQFSTLNDFNKVEEHIKNTEIDWDLILLDLRLTDEDYEIKLPKRIIEFSGGKLLKDIKNLNPAVPVIMFTASNKAWNIGKLINEGAEGFYIKESPEIGIDDWFSIENYKNFLQTVKISLEKGRYLKWFWKNTEEIVKHLNTRPDKDEDNKNIKSRIKDKLYLAYGILRSRIRRFDFDKNKFIIRDFDLAFLTYWGCLNEIAVMLIVDINDRDDILKKFDKYLEQKDKKLQGDYSILRDKRNHIDFTHPKLKTIKELPFQNEEVDDNIESRYNGCTYMFSFIYELITEKKPEAPPSYGIKLNNILKKA